MSCTDDIIVAFYRLYTIKAVKVDIRLHPASRAKPTCQWHVDTSRREANSFRRFAPPSSQRKANKAPIVDGGGSRRLTGGDS